MDDTAIAIKQCFEQFKSQFKLSENDKWEQRRWDAAKEAMTSTIAGLKAYGAEEVSIGAVVRNSVAYADHLIEEFRKNETQKT